MNETERKRKRRREKEIERVHIHINFIRKLRASIYKIVMQTKPSVAMCQMNGNPFALFVMLDILKDTQCIQFC